MLRRMMTGPHRRAGETVGSELTPKASDIKVTGDGCVLVDGKSYKIASSNSSSLGPGAAIYLGVAVAPNDREFGKWRKRALLFGMYNYSRYVVAADFKQIDKSMFDTLKAMLYKHGVPSEIYASKSFYNALSNIPDCSSYLDEFEAELGLRFVLTPPEDSSVKSTFAGITARLYESLSSNIFYAHENEYPDYQSVVDKSCNFINSCRVVDNKNVAALYQVEKRCMRFPNQ